MKEDLILKLVSMLIDGSDNGNLVQEDIKPISMLDSMIGKYVIVRSRNEGINAGIVKALDNTGIILSEARRIWYHKPKNKKMSWYEGVAESGLSSDSKVSTAVSEKAIIEDYSITVCSGVGKKSISGHVSHEQN